MARIENAQSEPNASELSPSELDQASGGAVQIETVHAEVDGQNAGLTAAAQSVVRTILGYPK